MCDVNSDAVRLWLNCITPNDRLLILGGSGWFGRTAVFMSRGLGVDIHLVGSGAREFTIGERASRIHSFNFEEIRSFKPTVVIDTWFPTREKITKLGLSHYRKQCLSLIERSARVFRLASVERIVSLSSGAAIESAKNLEGAGRLADYGKLKKESEESVLSIASASGIALTVARVYSVSGSFVRRPRDYLFSDLALQSLRGSIHLEATRPVFRRYAAVEDVLALSLASAAAGGRVISTGGDLVESKELAEVFCRLVERQCVISRNALDPELFPDRYHSDNTDWNRMCETASLRPLDLVNQAQNVLLAMRHWGDSQQNESLHEFGGK